MPFPKDEGIAVRQAPEQAGDVQIRLVGEQESQRIDQTHDQNSLDGNKYH